jgi:hypothetical protein
MILSMIEMAIGTRCGRNTMMCTQELGLSAAPPLVCEPQSHGSLLLRARISARLGGNGDCGTGREGGRFSCGLGTEAKATVIKVDAKPEC